MSERGYDAQVASNIPKYFAYSALQALGFGMMAAIWVIFLQDFRGMSLTQATLIDVTFYIAATFGEVPTGMVADRYGRKISLSIGSVMLALGMIGWTLAPTMPLIIIAYVIMGLGFTFLSGAQDALFYESVQAAGRTADYTRLMGRLGAVIMGMLALGSILSGILATISLQLPLIISGVSLLLVVFIVLTFHEPPRTAPTEEHPAVSYRAMLSQAFTILRSRPSLRYPIFYAILAGTLAQQVEIVFLQPQAVALGVSVAFIGFIWAAITLINMVGSSNTERITAGIGEARFFILVPLIMVTCLVLLALIQVIPALGFIAIISFAMAVLRPLLMNRIQAQVADNMRATMLSFQSLMFIGVATLVQPSLGFVADKASLPTAFILLATLFSVAMVVLLWRGRHHLLHHTPLTDTEATLGDGLLVEHVVNMPAT